MLPFHLTLPSLPGSLFFFFNDTATTEIYTLSLHDALPISKPTHRGEARPGTANGPGRPCPDARGPSAIALYGNGAQGNDAPLSRGVGHWPESPGGLRAWRIPRASGIKRFHFAMADATRSALFPRPGPIRPRALEGRPSPVGKNPTFRIFSLRRGAACLCWRVLRDDGSNAAAGHDSAEISSRNCPWTSH